MKCNRKIRVAIQGQRGGFHESASRQYFGNNVAFIYERSLRAVCQRVADSDELLGFITSEGELTNRDGGASLLRELGVQVVADVALPLAHNLIALPGQVMFDLVEIHAHRQARTHCQQFFAKVLPSVKLVTCTDTGAAAEMIRRKQLLGVGTIASVLVAGEYQLSIIQGNINDPNYQKLRFWVIASLGLATRGKAVGVPVGR